MQTYLKEEIANDFAGFKNEEYEDILNQLKDAKIIFYFYDYHSYTGWAEGLVEKNGKLYEFNGSHCSCHGLSRQFELEETNLKTVMRRINEASHGIYSDHKEEIRKAFDEFLEGHKEYFKELKDWIQ